MACLLKALPQLSSRDITFRSMGAGGTDVILSEAAFKLVPVSVECKNQEASKKIYDWYEQAASHGEGQPLLVVKKNHKKPLAIVDAEYFIGLVTSGRQ